MPMPHTDKTLPPDLTRSWGTGPSRQQRPMYVDLLPPCNDACPAGENIQAWLALAQEGKFYEAWQALIRDNPMPAVHGRVCYHPCEAACNRAFVDNAVSIHAVERFLGDLANKNGWQPEITSEPSGKRVLIVGAGPSGLSAAYHLTRLGHQVEIREAGPLAGGMLHFGIPAYRLPRAELDQDIQRILDMGVKVTAHHKVDDVLAEMREGNFDAVFIAIGAHISKRVDIPAREAGKILDAVGYLREVELGEAPKLGRRVAIYGGGNTAMDAARTAKRLGAEEAVIIYRRDREHMPAHDFEADEALAEGVKINWLRTIHNIDETTFKVEVMELDENGQPQPTGRYETLQADALILALGQNVDSALLQNVPDIEFRKDGTVIVDEGMMTGHPGIFAGGDMVPSERTVTIATGHGKHAARHIDAWLRGTEYTRPPRHPVVGYERLHVWYLTEADRRHQRELDAQIRAQGFAEVVTGLTEPEVLFEAKRCFSCGNCFECDGCYGACPENAVIKLGPGKRYRYDYELCTGCAVCYEQCPCHAIEMVAEPASV